MVPDTTRVAGFDHVFFADSLCKEMVGERLFIESEIDLIHLPAMEPYLPVQVVSEVANEGVPRQPLQAPDHRL